MIEQPRFQQQHDVRIVQPDKVFFISEGGAKLLSARSCAAVAGLVDGARTVETIVKMLADKISAQQVYYVLALMESKGFTEDAKAAPATPALAFWNAMGLD